MKVAVYYEIINGVMKVFNTGLPLPGNALSTEYFTEDFIGETYVYLYKEVLVPYLLEFIPNNPDNGFFRPQGRDRYLWKAMPKSLYEALMNPAPVDNNAKKQAPKRKPVAKKDKPSNLRKLLREKKVYGGICSYGMEYLNTKTGKRLTSLHAGDVCHARINSDGYYPPRVGNREWTCSQLALDLSYELDKELAYKPWLDWFLKRSPFTKFIKPTTVYTAIKYGVLIDTEKTQASHAAWVAVTSRWLYERKDRLAMFNELKAVKGSSENAAFVAANTVKPAANGDWELWHNVATHDSFNSGVSLDNLTKVFKEGLVQDFKKKPLSLDTEWGYRHISAAYSVDKSSFDSNKETSLYRTIKEMPYIKEEKALYSSKYIIPKENIPELMQWLVTIVG